MLLGSVTGIIHIKRILSAIIGQKLIISSSPQQYEGDLPPPRLAARLGVVPAVALLELTDFDAKFLYSPSFAKDMIKWVH